MSEIVSLHVGQAGVQLGSACWELFCLEHGIGPDGSREESSVACPSFFQDTERGKFIPRCCFIDTEPDIIDKVLTGPQKGLYNLNHITTGKQDSADNFARGRHNSGWKIIEPALENVRRQVEKCDSFQGFFMYHSIGGGTGSGFSDLLLERLSADYSCPNFSFTVFPSPNLDSSVVEAYNSVLSTFWMNDHLTATFAYDNEALYNICQNVLQIDAPTFDNINRLIAQSVASITTSLRFNGPLNVNMDQILTNLIPYPRLKYLINSYSPFIPRDFGEHRNLSTDHLTQAVFEPNQLFAKCDLSKGKYLSCSLNYRGDVVSREVHLAVQKIKKNRSVEFASWCPTGFKCRINEKPPVTIPGGDLASSPRALGMTVNSTSVSELFSRQVKKFDTMYHFRAFVHWYAAYCRSDEIFTDARENLENLLEDYKEFAHRE